MTEIDPKRAEQLQQGGATLANVDAKKPQRPKPEAQTEARIHEQLTGALAHWQYENGWIRRKYRTGGWKGTLMVVNAVGHLAEAAWHHPDLTVSFAFVIVKLQTHEAKGITDRDFELAREIERVVQWQPGLADGALEGTPNDDARFKYIKYD